MFLGLGLQPHEEWEDLLNAGLRQTQGEPLSTGSPQLSPHSSCWWLWQMLRKTKKAMSPAPPLLGTQLTLTFFLPQIRSIPGPILKAGPGPGGGK